MLQALQACHRLLQHLCISTASPTVALTSSNAAGISRLTALTHLQLGCGLEPGILLPCAAKLQHLDLTDAQLLESSPGAAEAAVLSVLTAATSLRCLRLPAGSYRRQGSVQLVGQEQLHPAASSWQGLSKACWRLPGLHTLQIGCAAEGNTIYKAERFKPQQLPSAADFKQFVRCASGLRALDLLHKVPYDTSGNFLGAGLTVHAHVLTELSAVKQLRLGSAYKRMPMELAAQLTMLVHLECWTSDSTRRHLASSQTAHGLSMPSWGAGSDPLCILALTPLTRLTYLKLFSSEYSTHTWTNKVSKGVFQPVRLLCWLV